MGLVNATGYIGTKYRKGNLELPSVILAPQGKGKRLYTLCLISGCNLHVHNAHLSMLVCMYEISAVCTPHGSCSLILYTIKMTNCIPSSISQLYMLFLWPSERWPTLLCALLKTCSSSSSLDLVTAGVEADSNLASSLQPTCKSMYTDTVYIILQQFRHHIVLLFTVLSAFMSISYANSFMSVSYGLVTWLQFHVYIVCTPTVLCKPISHSFPTV